MPKNYVCKTYEQTVYQIYFCYGKYVLFKQNKKNTKSYFLDLVTSKACNQKISEHHFKATALMVITVSLSFFVFFKGVSPLTMSRISNFCPKIMSYLNYFCGTEMGLWLLITKPGFHHNLLFVTKKAATFLDKIMQFRL